MSAGRPENLISRSMKVRSNAALWATRNIGCQEAPYVGSMNCERVLQVQSRTREVMDPFGIAAVVIIESGGLDIAKSSEKPSNKDAARISRQSQPGPSDQMSQTLF